MVFVKSIWKLQELQQEHKTKMIFLSFILVFGSKILLYLLNSLFPFFNPSISFYRQCCDSGKLSKYIWSMNLWLALLFCHYHLSNSSWFLLYWPCTWGWVFCWGVGGGVSLMVGFDFCEMVVVLGFFVFVGCWVFLECSWTIEWNSSSNIYSFIPSQEPCYFYC